MYTFIKKKLLLIGVVACLYPLQVSRQTIRPCQGGFRI